MDANTKEVLIVLITGVFLTKVIAAYLFMKWKENRNNIIDKIAGELADEAVDELVKLLKQTTKK